MMSIRRLRGDPKTQGDVNMVKEELRNLYYKRLLPIEKHYSFHQFHSPSYEDADFDNKPMVLVMGQYSTGKTTFIRYLIEQDFLGSRVGPEPTTDCFTALMHGEAEGVIPGNALTMDPKKPFRNLDPFGNTFLNRFQCVQMPNQVLESISIIDTPGILTAARKKLSRGYDFPAVLRWFAERVDRIILLFDAHKLEFSDELTRAFGALFGYEDKLRVVLNKADRVDSQQLMRVYGALMWSLGKVFRTPEILRVYIGSFWSEPRQTCDHYELIELEEEDLLADIRNLPHNAAVRKLNDLVKRARLVRAHAHIISYLKQEMPTFFCKESTKHNLIYQLPVIFTKIQQQHRVPAGDFPDCTKMQEQLLGQNFSKFKKLKPSLMASLDKLLNNDIAKLVPMLQQQELIKKSLPGVLDGEFLGTFRREHYKRHPFKELKEDSDQDFHEWVVERHKPKYDEIFYNLSPNEGKLSGSKVKAWMMTTLLPNSVLAHIWRLSDVDGDGMLDNEEFALAVHLIEGKLEGHWLPRELPSYLLPPSKRLNTTETEI
ncbi:EH domain-containing protein 2-like [Nerophis lumbriciformis]|uniref:EH domain-containing protein 2-like n=1 Tax=Nerophis lumbriciformis TaxID=546530 RepID=UPI002ADFB524|nr:EH domain-containing protein 2-like [Nerophis lumbriciformis]XP_061781659.1 EH domain-containing protein 2-like [Nerophis lumbriciformis]XP_061781660.1 EH domain-containing protein 2-like [Nerophis lumbriciformis]